MSKNTSQRRGLALGSIFALVATLFVGAAPASATVSTDAFTITPATGTTFNMFVDEDFTIITTRKGTAFETSDFTKLKYSITTNRSGANNSTYSLRVLAKAEASSVQTDVSSSDAVKFGTGGAGADTTGYTGQRIYYVNSYAINGNADNLAYYATSIREGLDVAATTISPTLKFDSGVFETAAASGETVATSSFVVKPHNVDADLSNKLSIQLYAPFMTSASPSVTVTVTAFIDLNGNNVWDSATEPSKTQAINFKKYSELSVTPTAAAPTRGTMYMTASGAVSGVNFNQVNGKFFVHLVSANDTQRWQPSSEAGTFSDLIALTEATAAAGRLSASAEIAPALQLYSVSAQIGYDRDGTAAITDVLWPLSAGSTIAAPGHDDLFLQAVPSANLTAAGSARPNTTYTVRAGAHTGSDNVSVSGVVVEFEFSGQALSSDLTLAVNGGLAATSSHNAVEVTTDANGFATITLVASGYANGNQIIISANAGGYSDTLTLTMDDVGASDATLDVASSYLSMAPGSSLNIAVDVEDQYGENLVGTYRVQFAKSGAFDFGNSTNSYATVVGGTATGTVTSPALTTESMTVTFTLQKWSTALSRWEDQSAGGDTSVTVFVTNDVNGFAFPSGLASSYSATISYPATNWGSYSWSSVINTLDTVITGSSVVVSGAGLIIEDNVTGLTASDSITMRSSGTDRSIAFRVTALKAGSYTLTVTAGNASTTSLIVVGGPFDNAGKTLTFDTTQITPGTTKFVTGTLLDANGNPVDTSLGNADLVITFAGDAGIPVGTTPTETGADGTFRISLLTSAADKGTFTITATYRPFGSATATINKVTTVQAITIGAATAAASDQKLTVGSFKGYVAIYALNYTGQKLSAKVAGKWLVQEDLTRFQRVVRNTGAGYTIKVDLYIDGVFVRSETVTTK